VSSSTNSGPAGLFGADRTLVAGIVNVTPDSFSDGGEWPEPEQAIERGRELRAQGADLLDVGGESTRPGSRRIGVEEELRRISAVIATLAGEGHPISVDTINSRTAEAALAAGATIINDISGGEADPRMPHVAAEHDVPYVVTHWRGDPTIMNSLARYDDVAREVRDELARQVERVQAAGVAPERIILDPGLGFAKDGRDDWGVLAHLDVLATLGFPLFIGASRKRFLGNLLAAGGTPPPPQARDHATAAISALSALEGVWAVRVHDVAGSADAVRVAAAWRAARNDAPVAAPQ